MKHIEHQRHQSNMIHFLKKKKTLTQTLCSSYYHYYANNKHQGSQEKKQSLIHLINKNDRKKSAEKCFHMKGMTYKKDEQNIQTKIAHL